MKASFCKKFGMHVMTTTEEQNVEQEEVYWKRQAFLFEGYPTMPEPSERGSVSLERYGVRTKEAAALYDLAEELKDVVKEWETMLC